MKKVIDVECPSCNEKVDIDLGDSYEEDGQIIDEFYCRKCNRTFKFVIPEAVNKNKGLYYYEFELI